MVTHDVAKYLGVGFAKFLGGSVFSVGLILVVIAGAELFTGNNLLTMCALGKRISLREMIGSWLRQLPLALSLDKDPEG